MNEQQRNNRNISSGVIATVSAAVVAVSGGVAWLTSQTPETPIPGNPSQSIRQPQQPLTTQPGNEQTANIYWLKPTEKSFELVPQPIKIAAAQPNQALESAFKTLLAGPTEGTDSTTIPKGTKLLGMKVENNEVHVNLSEDFTSGGGSASMVGRVGQVVYTATTLNPQAKVYIDVNGKPLEVLGGEGVEIEQPLTRTTFNQNYPL
ncbi:GerMN domain-containing protein [Anabaena sphaerica FACHB-251]|uniref:GerMN domain-containing protein n=1 Tax=Anabaena sphaerica FACHB-251 TaxID=2692883 RepID=A0A926WLS5_9NOST|nr:GerMN domain-containing protein [Anabaena sphaerica]MBD2296955.1 GerMN domain-containing protein [Anabaena sphaerica FACHB-251]